MNALAQGPRRPERSNFILPVELSAKNRWQSAQALLDSGAERNLVSQIFVKEQGWESRGPPIPMYDLNGRSFHYYGVHELSFRVRDAFGKIREAQQLFYAVDMSEY